MAVNLEYYRTFYHVATLGNMSRAAEVMCLTPPTVTKTIQMLEQQLDCQLFTRSVKGVQLTQAGEALYSRVKPGLNLLDAGEIAVNTLNSMEGGYVRIAMSEAAAHFFTMPEVLGKFCTLYPKVNLAIKHMPGPAAQEAVLNGDIDFAIMSFKDDGRPKNLDVFDIFDSDNVAVVGSKLSHLAEKQISLLDLAAYPLIFTERNFSIRAHYEQLYTDLGLEFEPKIETPTLDIQLQAVQLGIGYSYVPYPYAKELIDKGELFMLDIKEESALHRSVCLITSKEAPLSRAAQEMVDILLDAAPSYC